jgi:ELWxxDGT repeat protein
MMSLALAGASLTLQTGCSADDDANSDVGGAGGSSASGGTAHRGGSGGTAGNGGSGGTSGNGASGGIAANGGGGTGGSGGATNVLAELIDAMSFVRVGSKVFFTATRADVAGASQTLWVTDGTKSGTHEVSPSILKSVRLDAEAYPPFEHALPVVNGKVVFNATGSDGVSHTYASDGTEGGTVELTDTRFSGAVAVVGTKLYFRGMDANDKFGLWVTDGTKANTLLVRADPNEFQALSVINGLAWNDKLYFYMYGDVTKMELWSTDGTPGGTTRLAHCLSSIYSHTMAVFHDQLFFAFAPEDDPDVELWVSDGTAGGTRLFKNLHPTAPSSPTGFQVLGERLVFTAYGQSNNGQAQTIWSTDGTVEGTMELSQAMHKTGEYTLPEVNGKLVFSTFTSASTHVELWSTDGTPEGTSKLEDLQLFSDRQVATVGQDQLVFFGTTTASAYGEPWLTDGTAAGTKQLTQLGTSDEGSIPFRNGYQAMTSLGDKAYFLAQTPERLQLFETDGTAEATRPLLPADTGIGAVPMPLGDQLLMFLGQEDASSTALYAHTPGTPIDLGGGGAGGGSNTDCEAACPSEVSDVQLDSFCRMACCYQVTGYDAERRDTCAAGSTLGTSSCSACQ